MKQVYLTYRSRRRRPLRSDTLFGLIAWGVRSVYGPTSVERFLAPLKRDPPEAPLVLTSAFPFVERSDGRVHYFPRPLAMAGGDGARPRSGVASEWIEDRELLAYVSGRTPITAPSRAPDAPRGLFFLATGPHEHYLEAALGFLERFGFGGGGANGDAAFDVELRSAEFLRLAQPNEDALLLSLYAPTSDERTAIQEAANRGDRLVHYALERRQGAAGGRLLDVARPFKRPVVMMREGSVLPRFGGADAGSSPVVGRVADGGHEHDVYQHGFGFFVPITGGTGGAS